VPAGFSVPFRGTDPGCGPRCGIAIALRRWLTPSFPAVLGETGLPSMWPGPGSSAFAVPLPTVFGDGDCSWANAAVAAKARTATAAIMINLIGNLPMFRKCRSGSLRLHRIERKAAELVP
jgi:hypothetical protein